MNRIIVSFGFCLTSLFSQGMDINGTVLDKDNGSPLVGANVMIEGTTFGAATDSKGRFIISGIPEGDHTIIASYMGYSTHKESISIGTEGSVEIEIQLEPEAIQMEEYVVTASRRRERIEDAPAAISVITKQDIRRESNTNLGDYLKGTKGIDFTQSGIDSYNMTARGFNSSFSSRLLTLVDGRMANVPSLRLTAYNVIPVSFEDVEQIEVVLGPSSALYGPNAHSGVLNIITSSPLREQGSKFNFQRGYLNQASTRPLEKYTLRTAHKYKNFGIKLSAVGLTGEDWHHYNEDEYEGHAAAFVGRHSLAHNRINDGNISAEIGSPTIPLEWLENEIPGNGIDDNGNGFTDEELGWGSGSVDDWTGPKFADGIDNRPFPDAETGSPLVDSAMVVEAMGDPYGRYFLANGIILYDLTYDDIGLGYKDGIDNDGDGNIDEGIDKGIDEPDEKWFDGIDNDGDGDIDEVDEIGSQWLDRFGNHYAHWDAPNGGFGDYTFDDDGNIMFDTNGNDIYNDNWGNDNVDNDNDGNVDEMDESDFIINYGDLPKIIKDADDDGINDFPDFNVRNIRYDLRMDWEPNSDLTASFSHGYAWARNINITGIARYLADGWIYNYYQGRIRWKNIFMQSYLNTSYSGDPAHPTRNLATGSLIFDRSKKFSFQLQHFIETELFFLKNRPDPIGGDLRLVWGFDYFLTLPDTRGTILSDRDMTDYRDNNGNGEAGSPNHFWDVNDSYYYDVGESYRSIDSLGQISGYDPTSDWGDNLYDTLLYSNDNVQGAVRDGIDNDHDSDDFNDIDGNGLPWTDNNGNRIYDHGVDQLEDGARLIKGTHVFVYADGKDNDGDGKIDENIDEGIDEGAEDNRYKVNELGIYYQLNWKLSDKLEFIHATRFDAHDRLTDIINFNNSGYNDSYSPLNWDLDLNKSEGVQFSPKFGLLYKHRQNQNYRITWAKAFNTPSNQALFLDIFVTRFSVFKVYARGADGGYSYPKNNAGSAMWYNPYEGTYQAVDSTLIYFYPSVDPKITGYFRGTLEDQPELEPEIVSSWEFGYKGKITENIYGTLDLYTSHYSSFVSGATFITPLVIKRSILTNDHNEDSITNTLNDDGSVNINDQDDYDHALDIWLQGLEGVSAISDTINGIPTPVVIGYVNYGEVDLWGLDGSLTIFLDRAWNIDLTYSHLGMSEFFNPITKAKDPINAPRNKAGMKLQYNSRRWPFTASLNARYVDGFKWSSGIYYGDISPYTIVDLHIGYEFNKYLSANFTINNALNNEHTEIIGGPSLGRVAVLRFQTKF